MVQKALGLILLVMLLAAGLGISGASAQDDYHARTIYMLNMRSGPGETYDVVAVIDSNTYLYLEARSEDNVWVLGRTVDGAARGWMASLYMAYTPGFNAFNLQVSNEVVSGAVPPLAAENAAPAEQAPAAENAPSVDAGPGVVRARTNYQMNVRSGPGTDYAPVGLVDGNVNFVLEAHNGDGSWVLGHTEDGQLRGWVAGEYLAYLSGSVTSLPASNEVTTGAAAASGGDGGGEGTVNPDEPPNPVYDGVNMGPMDPALIADIDLTAYPEVGRSTGRAYQIFLNGREMGNNPNVIAKVGDCSTEHWQFLSVFAWGQYNLGAYQDLQGVINHFGESLGYGSEAAHNGFNINVVGGPEWGNPAVCEPGESPLVCEYRIHKPSVAIIMFGTSDLLVMTPYEFDFYLRSIVQQTIDRGIIPVLSTFPGNLEFWNRTLIYNQIVVRVATDNDLPLINLWLALESLPNHGLEPDGFHLGNPSTIAGDLTEPNLQTGYAMRNLITLQTLDNIWRDAMQ
ncbi:MAG: hypothetical protein JXQ72_17665 [Anaerolineae bacterium]|nr:hypothetical protein [Anaerolineae bacterium]